MSDTTDWKQKFFGADNDVHELIGAISEVCDKIEGSPRRRVGAPGSDVVLTEILGTLQQALKAVE